MYLEDKLRNSWDVVITQSCIAARICEDNRIVHLVGFFSCERAGGSLKDSAQPVKNRQCMQWGWF